MNDLDLRTALHRDADLVGEPSPNLLEQLGQRRRHQRRQRAGVLTAALAVAVIAAGIPVGQSLLARSSSAPATSSTGVEETPSVAPTTEPTAPTTGPAAPTTDPASSTTDTSPPSSAAGTPTAAPPADSAAPVLGPDGLGSLKLGMSRVQAEATGLVEPFRNEPNSDKCLWRSALTGAPAGKGIVLYSDTFGVATVDAYAGVQTPEGVTIGSSLAAVESAYPGFQLDEHTGRGYVRVPGNSQVVYRLAFIDAKVIQLTLQYERQDCYE